MVKKTVKNCLLCHLGTETNPYDATRSGPLCPQMGLDQELFDHYLVNKNDQYCLDCQCLNGNTYIANF